MGSQTSTPNPPIAPDPPMIIPDDEEDEWFQLPNPRTFHKERELLHYLVIRELLVTYESNIDVKCISLATCDIFEQYSSSIWITGSPSALLNAKQSWTELKATLCIAALHEAYGEKYWRDEFKFLYSFFPQEVHGRIAVHDYNVRLHVACMYESSALSVLLGSSTGDTDRWTLAVTNFALTVVQVHTALFSSSHDSVDNDILFLVTTALMYGGAKKHFDKYEK